MTNPRLLQMHCASVSWNSFFSELVFSNRGVINALAPQFLPGTGHLKNHMVALGYVRMSQERWAWKRLLRNTTVEEKRNLHSRHAWRCCCNLAKCRKFPGVLCSTRSVCVHRLPNALAVWLRFPVKRSISSSVCSRAKPYRYHFWRPPWFLKPLWPGGLERWPYLSAHFIPTSGLCSLVL